MSPQRHQQQSASHQQNRLLLLPQLSQESSKSWARDRCLGCNRTSPGYSGLWPAVPCDRTEGLVSAARDLRSTGLSGGRQLSGGRVTARQFRFPIFTSKSCHGPTASVPAIGCRCNINATYCCGALHHQAVPHCRRRQSSWTATRTQST